MDEAHQLLDMLDSFENELNNGWDELGRPQDADSAKPGTVPPALASDNDELGDFEDYEDLEDLIEEEPPSAAASPQQPESPVPPRELPTAPDAAPLRLARRPALLEPAPNPREVLPTAPKRPLGPDFAPVLSTFADPPPTRAGYRPSRGPSRNVLEQLFGRVGT